MAGETCSGCSVKRLPLKQLTLERVKGIEPSSLAWKAMALPLSYTRACCWPTDRRLLPPARPPSADFRTLCQPRRTHVLPPDEDTGLGEDGIAGSRGGFDRRLRKARAGRLRCKNWVNQLTRYLIRWKNISCCPGALRMRQQLESVVEGEGFEPSKAEPSDLQSDPFDRSGTPPKCESRILALTGPLVNS